MLRKSAVLSALVAIHVCAEPSGAQKPDSAAFLRTRDSALKANSRRAELTVNGTLTGPGAEFLLRETSASQFTVIGERHGIREIPQVAGWLLDALRRNSGYSHLATENGALVTEVALRGPLRTSVDAVLAFAAKYPSAFEFNSDQDLTLVGEARAMISKGRAVWGLDQEFGAVFLLDRLRASPAPPAARRMLDSLWRAASSAESRRYDNGGRHWIAVDSRPEAFTRLRSQYGTRVTPDIRRVLEALETSAHLYDLNRRAGLREPVGFDANNEREELMKQNFVKFYDEAKSGGEKQPRVLLKMGQAHAGRGQSPFGPFTVGNLVANMATANGTKSFHVVMLAHNARADSTAPSLWKWPDMRPLAENAPARGITIIDLRPLRNLLHAGRLGQIDPDLRRTIYAFDAVMLIGGASNATELLTKPRSQ